MAGERGSRGSELEGAVCPVWLCFLRVLIGGGAGEELVDEPGGVLGIARYAEAPSSRGHVSQRSVDGWDPLVDGCHLQLVDGDGELLRVSLFFVGICGDAFCGGAGVTSVPTMMGTLAFTPGSVMTGAGDVHVAVGVSPDRGIDLEVRGVRQR